MNVQERQREIEELTVRMFGIAESMQGIIGPPWSDQQLELVDLAREFLQDAAATITDTPTYERTVDEDEANRP